MQGTPARLAPSDLDFTPEVAIRASHINGCGFCLDVHIKQTTMHGERL